MSPRKHFCNQSLTILSPRAADNAQGFTGVGGVKEEVMKRLISGGVFLGLLLCASTAGAGDIGAVLAQCAACHGPDGMARSDDVPNLAGQHELYLYNQLQAFRSGRRPHKEMRVMSRQLSDAEMRDIAAFYARSTR